MDHHSEGNYHNKDSQRENPGSFWDFILICFGILVFMVFFICMLFLALVPYPMLI